MQWNLVDGRGLLSYIVSQLRNNMDMRDYISDIIVKMENVFALYYEYLDYKSTEMIRPTN